MSDALNMTHHKTSTKPSCYFGSEGNSNVCSLTLSFPCTANRRVNKPHMKLSDLVKVFYVYIDGRISRECGACSANFMCVREACDDGDLTQRGKMSSESLTGANFYDLRCHWFPVGGSLMCCMSVRDGDSVWRGRYEEVTAAPIRFHCLHIPSLLLIFPHKQMLSFEQTQSLDIVFITLLQVVLLSWVIKCLFSAFEF